MTSSRYIHDVCIWTHTYTLSLYAALLLNAAKASTQASQCNMRRSSLISAAHALFSNFSLTLSLSLPQPFRCIFHTDTRISRHLDLLHACTCDSFLIRFPVHRQEIRKVRPGTLRWLEKKKGEGELRKGLKSNLSRLKSVCSHNSHQSRQIEKKQ